MSLLITLTTALLYIAPVVLFVAIRFERARPLWAIGLDIPVAVALDLLLQLTLTHVMRLQLAVLVSRLLWLTVALCIGVWQRSQLGWPRVLEKRVLFSAITAGALAVDLSMVISRSCHIHDRAWHIPLVSSLRGQQLPFHNVYQPETPIEYHLAGDIVAAAVQSLSFGHMHSSLALSVAHDVLFGLCGVTTALLLRAFGVRSVLLTVFFSLLPVLGGPMTAPFVGGKSDYLGYNFTSYYQVSFRPHCSLAGLLIVGFVGAALVALSNKQQPTGFRTGFVLVACTAALTLTDEASAGVLGLMLGAIWLVAPLVVHPRRIAGLVIFGVLIIAVLAPHYVYGGTLAPGSLRQMAIWVPWRSPGFYHPAILLSKPEGFKVLLRDILPSFLMLGAGLCSLLGARRREQIAIVAGLVLLFGITLVILCGVEVRADVPVPSGGFGGQNHRFMTALLVSAPLFVAASLMFPRANLRRSWLRAPVFVLGIASVVLGSGSTLVWAKTEGWRSACVQPSRYYARDDFFTVDCKRDIATPPIGERVRPIYGAASILYIYAGCNPSYLAGPDLVTYRMKIGLAKVGKSALSGVSSFVPSDTPLHIVCPRLHNYPSDPICTYVAAHSECRPAGAKILDCEISAKDRALLLNLPIAP